MSTRTGAFSPLYAPPPPPPSPQPTPFITSGRRGDCSSVYSLTPEESTACIGPGITSHRDARCFGLGPVLSPTFSPGNQTEGQGQNEVYSPSEYDNQSTPTGRRGRGNVRASHPWDLEEPDPRQQQPQQQQQRYPTTTGGTVPPPPAPGYQNTVTTSQQLASQAAGLHYHIDSAVNKITRTFDNGNEWSTDQVMKQADHMADVTERLEAQLVRQNEIIGEMRQIMSELKNEVVALRDRQFAEERLRAAREVPVTHPVFPVPAPASPMAARSFPRDTRIVTAPLSHPPLPGSGSGTGSGLRSFSGSSRETVTFNEPMPHPSNLRNVGHQSGNHGGSNPSIGKTKRGRSFSNTDMHQKAEASASKQGGGFLRTVKSKTSMSGLNKRADNVPPIPAVSYIHHKGQTGDEPPIPIPKTPRRRGLFPFGRRREDPDAEPSSYVDF